MNSNSNAQPTGRSNYRVWHQVEKVKEGVRAADRVAAMARAKAEWVVAEVASVVNVSA